VSGKLYWKPSPGTTANHSNTTLYAMGEAGAQEIRRRPGNSPFTPEQHYNLVELSPFHLENSRRFFLPTDEPHGLIEATLRND